MVLTNRFADALAFAQRLHRTQTRKGTQIPYLAHLLAVCATTLEWGADEDVAIAALLHDAVEDQGGLPTAELIRSRFGERVARMVLDCSALPPPGGGDPASTWLARKQDFVLRLRTAKPDVALVVAADKLHNCTAMVRDVRRLGPATLGRFRAPPQALLWYLAAVTAELGGHEAHAPVHELREQIAALAALLAVEVRP